jgi:hypothetical protein
MWKKKPALLKSTALRLCWRLFTPGEKFTGYEKFTGKAAGNRGA